MLLDVTHPVLHAEITAIGGYYLFSKEGTLWFQDRKVLYWVGCAVLSNTCCGMGGVSYVKVQGFVQRHRYKQRPSGEPVSLVEPIANPRHREEIRKMLVQKEKIHQVEFQCPTEKCFTPSKQWFIK